LILVLTLTPVWRRRASQCKPEQARALFERSELRERRALREAQGTREAGKPPGSPFFWVLFFGGAKKSISPFRAKLDDE
jgi:hypothetical protein